MARKRGKSWQTDFMFQYQRIRRKSPENSKAGAEAYEAMLRHKLAIGEVIVSPKDIKKAEAQEQTFEKFAWKWFNSHVRANLKQSGIENTKIILRAHLIPFFGNVPIGKINTMKIDEFKAKKINEHLANKSVNNYLTILNTCLKAAQEGLGLTTLPRVKLLKTPPQTYDFLTIDESNNLLANLSGMAREIVLTAIRTGLRKGELKALRWQDIDWVNRRLVVRHSWCRYTKGLTSPKSNKFRYVPLTDDVYFMLKDRKQETGPIFYTNKRNQNFDYWTLKCKMLEACKNANLRFITVHTLRHTFASHLVMKGAPLIAVQQLLGHSDIRITMRYAHLSQSSLREAINLLDPMRITDFGHQVVTAEKQVIEDLMRQKTTY
ncbi:hypothetical protein A2924_00590 [Candidatus Giovannonibacteria bacterium RIFCSPLOWO2_01_FULL_44_16]|uniref:Tyr recombinase domain-containing protein n=1 Tax=Candidatus Giovannonibacteria bacterium RIFCSPLOWO2_01_FULL_44_16 TaxID=1798348 RepID=A0A1F5X5S1_9BACT|nr:MAG: hypothetical protein A2924_00590 [Candidatus Giovannonibacteria bacterium RIFCSPLOWO2_01_FULL_44_16]